MCFMACSYFALLIYEHLVNQLPIYSIVIEKENNKNGKYRGRYEKCDCHCPKLIDGKPIKCDTK